jgi:hypothetical protein
MILMVYRSVSSTEMFNGIFSWVADANMFGLRLLPTGVQITNELLCYDSLSQLSWRFNYFATPGNSVLLD